MKNIKFAFEQMKTKKWEIVFKIVQISMALIVLAYLLQSFFAYNKLIDQLRKVMDESDIYVFRDQNSSGRLTDVFNNEKYTVPLGRLVDKILERPDQFMIVGANESTDINHEKHRIYKVTENFFDKYEIRVESDSTEWKEKFGIHTNSLDSWETQTRPIIVGSNFKKSYDLGEEMEDDYGRTYRVVGFIEKNAVLALPMQSAEIKYLNDALFIPQNVDKQNNGSMVMFFFSCQFLGKEAKELEPIAKINRDEKILDISLCSYAEQMKKVRSDTLEKEVLFGTFGGILFLFSMIGIVCMLIQMVADYSFEYAVNLVCGATLFQIVFMMGIGVACTCLFLGPCAGTLCILGIAIFSTCIIALYVHYKINFQKLTDTLRE